MPRRESAKTVAERKRLVDIGRALIDALSAADPDLGAMWRPLSARLDAPQGVPVVGWRMALSDLLESASDLSPSQRDALRARLLLHSYSLAELVAEFRGKPIATVLKRGRIRSDEEYHLLRDIADDTSPPAGQESTIDDVRRLVAEYESARRK